MVAAFLNCEELLMKQLSTFLDTGLGLTLFPPPTAVLPVLRSVATSFYDPVAIAFELDFGWRIMWAGLTSNHQKER